MGNKNIAKRKYRFGYKTRRKREVNLQIKKEKEYLLVSNRRPQRTGEQSQQDKKNVRVKSQETNQEKQPLRRSARGLKKLSETDRQVLRTYSKKSLLRKNCKLAPREKAKPPKVIKSPHLQEAGNILILAASTLAEHLEKITQAVEEAHEVGGVRETLNELLDIVKLPLEDARFKLSEDLENINKTPD